MSGDAYRQVPLNKPVKARPLFPLKDTIMTPQQIERNREFLKDLRANEKKAKSVMRDDNGGRCCLCVAYDTAQRLGANLPDHSLCLPPLELADFYGWPRCAPYLSTGNGVEPVTFLNDGTAGAAEHTHAEIADAFEQTFPELKQ